MSAEIIPFPNPNVDQDVVKMLEHTLSLAKEGKVQFVAVAWTRDGVGAASWAPDAFESQADVTAALGSVQFLSARFNEAVLIGSNTDNAPEAA